MLILDAKIIDYSKKGKCMDKKYRILIIDDNPYILNLLSTVLNLKNFDVSKAKDGEEALSLIVKEGKEKFDIIVTDYQMPIINGLELAETLKKYETHKNIPILLLTQRKEIRYETDERYAIFDKILYKPAIIEKLVEDVMELLTNNEK